MKIGDLIRLRCNHSQVYLVSKICFNHVFLVGFPQNQVFNKRDLQVINENR